jgi:ubiquinone/menaquinone biosynthesis C-methylase UbiE
METLKAPVNLAFSGSIPNNYDTHLGPLFFEPFALIMAERIAAVKPAAVLELACGTGRLTRHIADRLGEKTRLVATDVNPAMLGFAREAVAAKHIEWGTVDAVELPYPDASFDMVVAQFGVMFYSDRVKAYSEALRVLKPGGRLLFTCWDRIEENPTAHITHQLVLEAFPVDTPAFYAVPFAYHDRVLIREEVLLAGFHHVNMELAAPHGYINTAADAARGLLEGSPIHTAIVERDPSALPALREQLTQRLTVQFGAIELDVPLSAWVVEAFKDPA